jgi:hypothetical protein
VNKKLSGTAVLGIDHCVDVSAAARRNAGFCLRRAVLRSFLFAGAALPLAGCWGDGTVVKRIKVIAKAEVDGKIVEGSSVTELKWRPRYDGGMHASEQGEAVVLELPGRGVIYVLSMTITKDGSDNGHIWPREVQLAVGLKGGIHKEDLPKIQAFQGRVPFIAWAEDMKLPIMAAFKDESEFRSVYQVLPNDFSKHFGAGVKFIGVEFEVTEEPITDGVLAKRLPMILQRPKKTPEAIDRDSNGNLISYKKLPFEYKYGPKVFFSERNF